jgi:hypothetical protein
MATPSVKIDEHPVSLHTDKTVRRLDLFPELLQALRDGDVLTGRLFRAELFDCDAQQNRLVMSTPTMQAAMNVY